MKLVADKSFKKAFKRLMSKNPRLYRICHAKLLTTHACKACTARL